MQILERRLLVFPQDDLLDALRCYAEERGVPLPETPPDAVSFSPSAEPAIRIGFPSVSGEGEREFTFTQTDLVKALMRLCLSQNVPLPHGAPKRLARINDNVALMMEMGKPGLHIMIIDDHDTMREMIKKLLIKTAPSRVTEAKDGIEALEILKSQSLIPDIIICDIHTQRMSGIEFIRTLRSDDSSLNCCTPVIVLTADRSETSHDAARDAGASRVLTKPISAANLNAQIKQVCG